jgi:hypothetical protein
MEIHYFELLIKTYRMKRILLPLLLITISLTIFAEKGSKSTTEDSVTTINMEDIVAKIRYTEVPEVRQNSAGILSLPSIYLRASNIWMARRRASFCMIYGETLNQNHWEC